MPIRSMKALLVLILVASLCANMAQAVSVASCRGAYRRSVFCTLVFPLALWLALGALAVTPKPASPWSLIRRSPPLNGETRHSERPSQPLLLSALPRAINNVDGPP